MSEVLVAPEQTRVKSDELVKLMTTAPSVIEANKLSNSRAIEAGRKLLEQVKQNGMNPQLDELIADFVKKGKITIKNMNDKRAPFTQMMTMVAKEFTGLENEVKEIVDEAQKVRDEFAAKVMKERQEAERQATLKLAKDNEKIEIEKQYRIAHSEKYTDYLLNFKTSKMDWFNGLTLESIDSAEATIKSMSNGLSDGTFVFDIPFMVAKYHTLDEVKAIVGDIQMGLTYSSLSDFQTNIATFQRELMDILPSKKNQLLEAKAEADRLEAARQEAEKKRLAAEAEKKRLEEEAKKLQAENVGKLKLAHDRLVYARTGFVSETNADQVKDIGCKSADVVEYEYQALKDEFILFPEMLEYAKALETEEANRIANEKAEADRKRQEAERLEAERKRQEEEAEKLRQEAAKKQEDAQASAAVAAAGQSATAFVDTQATLFEEAPKVKEGYSIKVLNPAAYLLIIQFWFEKEGRNLPTDKIEGKSIAQMKAFCEKHAVKTEELIVSPLLKYEPVYKAK